MTTSNVTHSPILTKSAVAAQTQQCHRLPNRFGVKAASGPETRASQSLNCCEGRIEGCRSVPRAQQFIDEGLFSWQRTTCLLKSSQDKSRSAQESLLSRENEYWKIAIHRCQTYCSGILSLPCMLHVKWQAKAGNNLAFATSGEQTTKLLPLESRPPIERRSNLHPVMLHVGAEC